MKLMRGYQFLAKFKERIYCLGFREWSILTKIPIDTLRSRYKKFKEGKLAFKWVLYVGNIPVGKPKGNTTSRKKRKFNQDWLYRKESFDDERYVKVCRLI